MTDRISQYYGKDPSGEQSLSNELKAHMNDLTKDATLTKKKIAEKKQLLQKVKLKFLRDQITEELYKKYTAKIREEIAELDEKNDTLFFNSSNFQKAIKKCFSIAQNQSQAWISADYENKQQLQKLVFPEGILYHKQKGVVRTPKVISLYAAIPLLARVSAEINKADSFMNRL